MTPRDEPHRPTKPLPLTEPVVNSRTAEFVTESDIRALVDSFYEVVRADDLLGPIFTRHVADWSLHLPKMCNFWSTVVLRTGRYAGRPLEAHERLPGLTQAHFNRWLALWERCVAETVAPEAREAFIVAATRMAASMSARLVA